MQKDPMSKNQELNILANLFNKLSEEEREELLDLVNKKKIAKNKNEQTNRFLDLDIQDDDPKLREISKKLNKTATKSNKSQRKAVKMIDVECKNCGKIYNLPENYPSIKNFICCV